MTSTTATTQYWLFQANPKIFRLKEALQEEALYVFPVKSHRDKIHPGDKVILWQAGQQPGCYALAMVTSEVDNWPMPSSELQFFDQEIERDPKVKLQIEYNLWNKPITKEILPNSIHFEEFYAGLPGTTFKATEQQYQELKSLIEQLDVAEEPEVNYNIELLQQVPLNQIFYGPPGTGKTFQTINHALAIIENRSMEELALEDRATLRQRFQSYLSAGQIAFVTFHQSFSYEDFVEGIKPVVQNGKLNYEVQDGIFKLISQDARRCLVEAFVRHQPKAKQHLEFKQLYEAFLDYLKSEDFQYFQYESQYSVLLQSVLRFGNLSVRPVKSYGTMTIRRNQIKKLYDFFEANQTAQLSSREIRAIIGAGDPEIYWAVFSELKQFEIDFRHSIQENEDTPTEDDLLATAELPPLPDYVLANCRRYVLIIDELNRGNVSGIFGDLITLIERDKREGAPEALQVILPYSKTFFSVPSNLYLIGTMNTADRNAETLDLAFRRRFAFREMLPQPQLLGNTNQKPIIAGIDLAKLLTTINHRLVYLLDTDHQIGHTFFMEVTSLDDLRRVFSDHILPLLQEFFFQDLGKIGLVLGKSFIEGIKEDDQGSLASFDYPFQGTWSEKRTYRLKPIKELDEKAFIQIYSQD